MSRFRQWTSPSFRRRSLADFLTNAPDKSFLFEVTSGKEVGTATINGAPCRHLLFTQPPGIERELWGATNDRSLLCGLIVTYRSQPGQPSFVAELSEWDFSARPTDAEFVFQPPQGAIQVEMKTLTGSSAKRRGAEQ